MRLSVEVGGALQSRAIYDYTKSMRATGFKFYTQYSRDTNVFSRKNHQKWARRLGVNKNHSRAKYLI